MTPLFRIAFAAALALLPALAAAQTWPTHPIRVIVPFPAGGATDALVRAYGDALSRSLGEQVVVDNRGGAAGAIGTEAVAKAPPDGYTFLFSAANPLTIIPHLRRTAYTNAEFVPVARIGTYVAGLGVRASLGVNTMAEFIALAKSKPGGINYATSGYGGGAHIRMEALQRAAGVKFTHIPYKGGADQLPDLLAGHVDAMTENIIFPHAKAGSIKLLAMIADKRLPDFPDVPTIGEAGYPEVNLPLTFAAWAPAGTPDPIVRRMNTEIVKAAREPEMRDRMLTIGFIMEYDTPEEIGAKLRQEYDLYGKIIRDADIKME